MRYHSGASPQAGARRWPALYNERPDRSLTCSCLRNICLTKRIIKDSKAKKLKAGGQEEESQGMVSQSPSLREKQTASKSSSRNRLGPITEVEGRLPVWKIVVRLGGFALVVVLNIALIMSNVINHSGVPHHWRDYFLYGALLFFNATILIPALFEVRWLKMTKDGLELSTLWWKSTLSWSDLLEFRHPHYLKIAMLKTRKCMYLLNKRDLTNYDLIESGLVEKVK